MRWEYLVFVFTASVGTIQMVAGLARLNGHGQRDGALVKVPGVGAHIMLGDDPPVGHRARITLDQVESAIEGIQEKYSSDFYPFELRQSGGGWQFLTKREYHKTIAQLNGDKFLKRLSNAAMETLAIIAYKQPITKSEIETIRGVSSDYSIQKLLEKELIIIKGRHEHYPGKPLVYGTSRQFMDYFGLNDPNQLPKIDEVLAEQFVEPTLVNAEHFEIEPGAMLSHEMEIATDRPQDDQLFAESGEADSNAVSEVPWEVPEDTDRPKPASDDDALTGANE